VSTVAYSTVATDKGGFMDKTQPRTNRQARRPPRPAAPQGQAALASKSSEDEYAFEATSYLRGLFQEFQQQKERYVVLTGELLSLEARIELVERTVCLTRDHLAMTINKTDSALPNDWTKVLNSVRFVGMRLADACVTVLQEQQKMTPKEILLSLNKGMFRFRTNSPLREIHAALLRQSCAQRVGNSWVWTGTADQIKMRFRVVKSEIAEAPVPEAKESQA
jgi:hypothetical protein